ncbi:MAG: immunoglobulin domain-containing protein, partial [Candidatus Paceibacteria bacterium]
MNKLLTMNYITSIKALMVFSIVFVGAMAIVPTLQVTFDVSTASVVALACDCDGDDPGPGPDGPGPQVPPTCEMSANRTSIAPGESAQLTWSTTNASNITLQRPNNTSPQRVGWSGTQSVSPNSTYTYILTASNQVASVQCPVRITVTQPPAPVPVCTLSIDRSQVTMGESARLTWTSQNATSATLNWSIGNVALNGNRNVTPSTLGQRNYTLTVRNAEGVERNCRVQLTVNEPAPAPVPVCTLSIDRSQVTMGESARLT